jgi:CBS domain-containing protein
MKSAVAERAGPYLALETLRVQDAMHFGFVSCRSDTPLRTVARLMSTSRVHAVLVTAYGEQEPTGGESWGIVADTDLIRAAGAAGLDEQAAGAVATVPAATARLMVEEKASHLIVVDPRSGKPIGMLSTLDVARALAGFPERHPL